MSRNTHRNTGEWRLFMTTSSRVFRSSAFLLAIQLIQRSLGLVSTLILPALGSKPERINQYQSARSRLSD